MKTLLLAVIALIPPSLAAGPEPIRALSIKWREQFGSSQADKHTTFCLMARGFFRSPTTNIQAVTDAWLIKHPKAVLVPVSSMPSRVNDPQSKLTFVWVVDGDEILNLELVRQGCFHPATETIGGEQKLEVPQAEYDAFTKKLTTAAEYAHGHALGVWKNTYESRTPRFAKEVKKAANPSELQKWAMSILRDAQPAARWPANEIARDKVPVVLRNLTFEGHPFQLAFYGLPSARDVWLVWGGDWGMRIGPPSLRLKSNDTTYYMQWKPGIYFWHNRT